MTSAEAKKHIAEKYRTYIGIILGVIALATVADTQIVRHSELDPIIQEITEVKKLILQDRIVRLDDRIQTLQDEDQLTRDERTRLNRLRLERERAREQLRALDEATSG